MYKTASGKNWWKDVIKGVGISLVISLGLCAAFSILLIKEILKEEWLEYLGLIILLISVFVGCRSSIDTTDRKRIWIPLCVGMIFQIILGTIHLLMFRGPLYGILEITAAVVAGSVLSILLKREKGKGRRRKTSMRYR